MRVLHILFFFAVYFRLAWLIDPLPSFFDQQPLYSSEHALHKFQENMSFGFFLLIYSYSSIVWIAKVSQKLKDSKSRKHYVRKTITLMAYLIIILSLLLILTQGSLVSQPWPMAYCLKIGLAVYTLAVYLGMGVIILRSLPKIVKPGRITIARIYISVSILALVTKIFGIYLVQTGTMAHSQIRSCRENSWDWPVIFFILEITFHLGPVSGMMLFFVPYELRDIGFYVKLMRERKLGYADFSNRIVKEGVGVGSGKYKMMRERKLGRVTFYLKGDDS